MSFHMSTEYTFLFLKLRGLRLATATGTGRQVKHQGCYSVASWVTLSRLGGWGKDVKGRLLGSALTLLDSVACACGIGSTAEATPMKEPMTTQSFDGQACSCLFFSL